MGSTNSTLRQELFNPGHGSYWKGLPEQELPTTRNGSYSYDKSVDGAEFSQPSPTWTATRFTSWIRARCSSSLGCCTRVPESESVSDSFKPIVDLNSENGLFPVLHADAFGINGVRGLDQWIFDSGATSSCSNNISHFTNISRDVPFKRIRVANNTFAPVEGIGEVHLHVRDSVSNTTAILKLYNVLYIPVVPVCLVSTRAMFNDSGIRPMFDDRCTLVLPHNRGKIEFKSVSDTKSNFCRFLLELEP